jgi:CRISPR-associated protein Csy3
VEKQLEKDQKNPNNPNIQRIETAHLPQESDTLLLNGSINFLANSMSPCACNSENFEDALSQFFEIYTELNGFEFLSERYFMNLINGRILWRNRYGRDVHFMLNEVTENGLEYRFAIKYIDPGRNLSLKGLQNDADRAVAGQFVQKIAAALKGDLAEPVYQLNFRAVSRLGFGQEVYPSQEFPEKKPGWGEVKKELAKIMLKNGGNQAFIHKQKIGNALRTIDSWYQDNAGYPIAVEPYGVDQRIQKAMRFKNKNDFYTYLVKLDAFTQDMRKHHKIDNETHFMAACFIRGGVFSKAK